MKIPSGSTDRRVPFVAVDATDLKTRETGLTGFTVYRSRDGGTATVYTTPTIAEASAANMPGLYWLTIDEDTTIGAGHDVEQYVVHITHASMAPVTLSIDIERVKFTEGQSGTMANSCVDADVERFAGTAGTFAAGRPEVNMTHIAGAAVNTSSAQLGVNVVNFGGAAGTFAAGRPEVNTSHIAGSAVSTTSAQIGVNVVNAAGTAWNSGSITAGTIAADAIGASELAADAAAEIADAVWDEARAGHVTAGSFGEGVASVQGNVTGSVGSVTGAVGSVTGNVGGSVNSVTAAVTVGTNNDKTGYRLSASGVDDVLDDAVEGTTTVRQMLRGFSAALLGKASGLDANAPKYRDLADTKDRISATTDANGNRSAVTLDLT